MGEQYLIIKIYYFQ